VKLVEPAPLGKQPIWATKDEYTLLALWLPMRNTSCHAMMICWYYKSCLNSNSPAELIADKVSKATLSGS
jgi:hypothetical protein